VAPVAAGLVHPASFFGGVGRLVHVEVGVQLEEALLDLFRVVRSKTVPKLGLQLGVPREVTAGVRRGREGGEQRHQPHQPFSFNSGTLVPLERRGQGSDD
jgi:hypothetical protein